MKTKMLALFIGILAGLSFANGLHGAWQDPDPSEHKGNIDVGSRYPWMPHVFMAPLANAGAFSPNSPDLSQMQGPLRALAQQVTAGTPIITARLDALTLLLRQLTRDNNEIRTHNAQLLTMHNMRWWEKAGYSVLSTVQYAVVMGILGLVMKKASEYLSDDDAPILSPRVNPVNSTPASTQVR